MMKTRMMATVIGAVMVNAMAGDYDNKGNENCLMIAVRMTIAKIWIKVCVIKQ